AIPDLSAGEAWLTSLIRELADLVRRYNASLYRLRRLHYFTYFRKHKPWPPKNPHGDPVLPPAVGKTLKDLVKDAERDWTKRVIPDLVDFLNSPYFCGKKEYSILAADMIEVNNYIVSMRVVAVEENEDGEVGGSSSHVSISSAFSSS